MRWLIHPLVLYSETGWVEWCAISKFPPVLGQFLFTSCCGFSVAGPGPGEAAPLRWSAGKWRPGRCRL